MSAMVNFWILFFQHVMLEEIGPLSICLSLFPDISLYLHIYHYESDEGNHFQET